MAPLRRTTITASTAGFRYQPLALSFVTQYFPPDYAATGQLIDELARQLGRQGTSIEVFTGQPGYAFSRDSAPKREHQGNVRVIRSRLSQLWPGRLRGKAINGILFTLRTFFYMLAQARKNRLLVLTTAPPFLPILGYFASCLFGASYACILYDLYPDIAVELNVVPHRHIISRAWRWMNQLVWRRAEAIIVLSPDMKHRIAGHCPAVADKISVIHSWTDPDKIVPLAKQDNWFAQKHNLVKPFTVLYSGNMGRCHDIETIFEAAKLLANEPIQFLCIGGGAKRQQLIEDVEAAGLSNFLFLPYQEKEDLPYSMTACDMSLVSVSDGMESLVAPSKLYPALAAERPIAVICPERSYLRDTIRDAGCGTTLLNGDAAGLAKFICLLASDPELTARFGRSGRRYLMTHFTPRIISQQYAQVLKRSAMVHR